MNTGARENMSSSKKVSTADRRLSFTINLSILVASKVRNYIFCLQTIIIDTGAYKQWQISELWFRIARVHRLTR